MCVGMSSKRGRSQGQGTGSCHPRWWAICPLQRGRESGVRAGTPVSIYPAPAWAVTAAAAFEALQSPLGFHLCTRNKWAFLGCFSHRFPSLAIGFLSLLSSLIKTQYKIEGFSAILQGGGVSFLCSQSEISNCITSIWMEAGDAKRCDQYTVRRKAEAETAMDVVLGSGWVAESYNQGNIWGNSFLCPSGEGQVVTHALGGWGL